MRRRNLFFGVIAILFLGLVFGCEDNSQSNLDDELGKAGKVVVKLTDAPFPSDLVAEANVTVDWVKLGKTSETNGAGKKTDDDNFFVINLEENSTFNLLELSNGITTIIGEAEIPTGEYNEIRLHIVDAGIILTDGSEFALKVPSGDTSGLKIKIRPSLFIVQDAVSEVLLDFDVSRSFKSKGNFKDNKGKKKVNGFNFKPVVRAVNMTEAGEISGLVTDAADVFVEDALITLLSGTDTVTTAITSKDGYYAVIGIPEGTYTVSCEKESYVGQQVENVNVVNGEVTEQNFVLEESTE